MWVDEFSVPRYETVKQAVSAAESILPGRPRRRVDPRWQAMIEIAEFIESDPDPVWEFVCRWGSHKQEDLRDAVACVLLEHLLEHHFTQIFPLVDVRAANDQLFADMFCRCWKFGQSERAGNAQRFDELRGRIMKHSKGARQKRPR